MPKLAVGQAQPLGVVVHDIGESLFGAGDALGQHDRRIIARQGDDAVQQILDADLLVRATGTWSIRPAGPCHFCQVSGRTVHILSSFRSPFLISSKATLVVIILAIDAGGMR